MSATMTRHYALFLGTPVLTGTITAPTCGGTASSADVTVTWTFAPGPQVSFTVQVFTDAALTNLVYYSGVIASATQSHVIPAPALANNTVYYVLVDFVNSVGTSGQAGGSGSCSFTTNFAPSVAVTGVSATAFGGCKSPSDIPRVQVRWTQVVPGAGETFVSYSVMRREGGSAGAWVRIYTTTTVGTVSYTDYTVKSRARYEYAVIWQATVAGPLTLVSSYQSPAPQAQVDFDHMWIHEVGAEATNLRYDQWEADIRVIQDIATVPAWGRQAPVAQFGELQYHEVSIPALSRPLGHSERHQWVTIESMLGRQRTAAAVYCVRLGRAEELWFCALHDAGRRTAQKTYNTTIRLTEIEHSEVV